MFEFASDIAIEIVNCFGVRLKFVEGAGVMTSSLPSTPNEQFLPLPTPYYKMFLERFLNDPQPPHFKPLLLLPPTPSTTPAPSKNFNRTFAEKRNHGRS